MRRQGQRATSESLEDDRQKAQADEIVRILGSTCDLLDAMLEESPIPPKKSDAVIDRMKAFLDRRRPEVEDPNWIVRMRQTVDAYLTQRARANEDDAFTLD